MDASHNIFFKIIRNFLIHILIHNIFKSKGVPFLRSLVRQQLLNYSLAKGIPVSSIKLSLTRSLLRLRTTFQDQISEIVTSIMSDPFQLALTCSKSTT